MDALSREQRSRLMARVGRRDTRPELVVRRLVRFLGYRFRPYKKGLPGTPDLVFVSRSKVIFVHGCFWHRHQCKRATTPASNRRFWKKKFKANVIRDRRQRRALRAMGWDVLTVWECQSYRTNLASLQKRIKKFLGRPDLANIKRQGTP